LVSEQALGKTGQGPIFPSNFKVAVPKTEVLEQPPLLNRTSSFLQNCAAAETRKG
jgi:hypothetical protein